jgi:hypothetical protein
MNKVLEQYIDHLTRLAGKKPSANRNKGIAYYTAAAECITALILADTPEWVGLKFEKAGRL